MANSENIKGQGFHTNPERINKNGRPKGFKGLTATLRDIVENDGTMVLHNAIEIDEFGVETGKVFNAKVKIPTLKKIIEAVVKKAEKGDIRAIQFIFDRLEGKIQQSVSINTKQPVMNSIDISGKSPEEIAAIKKALENE